MRHSRLNTAQRLMCGAAAIAILSFAGAAQAEERAFTIEPQSLSTALAEFGAQSGHAVMAPMDLLGAKTTRGFSQSAEPEIALAQLLDGTGLTYRKTGDTFAIVGASDPQSGSAAGDGADAGTVAALIVTAQKREEQIQDVPIAISAFTEKSLEEQKIEGGFDLLKAIPNVTFSKNNFSSYNFSIRGIGTKAVSATTDPGVAVSFNNASLIQNRLFEQEYFDVERVEVLRGPQGTLYGRNATAGVINVISAKPNLQEFSGWVKGEVGNYHSKRISAMVNVPLVEDKLAIRIAGALTDRQGYDYNATTKNHVNGRDLWSGRVTVAFSPTDHIRTSLVWERFNEDDNRSRTGKQLCKRDPGPDKIGNTAIGIGPLTHDFLAGAGFGQGCLPVSLYDDQAFQTPNGLAMPFVGGALTIQDGHCLVPEFLGAGGYSIGTIAPGLEPVSVLTCGDPYRGRNQTRDLRVINSLRDPIYRANADVVQLSFDFDISPALTLSSQTTYDKDHVYSLQDYNRFNTNPVFTDTSNLYNTLFFVAGGDDTAPSQWRNLAPGGVFCDPQIGCSNTMVGVDISQASSSQWIQELRLASNFSGPINFTVGANYTRFKVLVDYYVMFNLITALSETPPFSFAPVGYCNIQGFFTFVDPPLENGDPSAGCPYVDPNPVESINGEGHNYYRSKNPYKLNSAAAFGELYWQIDEVLKLTVGLRYTDDRKVFTPVPTQILMGTSGFAGGYVSRGYPADPDIKQRWGEVTGRLGLDWKPDLSFTDQTMVYGFYSRGYKGGGANPPRIGYATSSPLGVPILQNIAQNSTPTFKPEFVNALEIGSKNTLLGGALTLNNDVFFYDYKDYQVSKVVDRSVSNENFDARVWGAELQLTFAPSRALQLIGNFGYLDTEIGKGAYSIDVMNRTAGNPNYVLVKPWLQFPSNCIAPVPVAEAFVARKGGLPFDYFSLCGGRRFGIDMISGSGVVDPILGGFYNPLNYPINGGAGIAQNLEGRELPNSPHWTANIGGQYGFEFMEGWRATIRADAYWQSQSWARVYNAVNDKLHGWYNANLSLWLERPDDGLKIEIYAKNILDKTPITDAFINSDDTALTTNVFVLDPRLIGLSIKKDF